MRGMRTTTVCVEVRNTTQCAELDSAIAILGGEHDLTSTTDMTQQLNTLILLLSHL